MRTPTIVKITKLPRGDLPLEMRQLWVGLALKVSAVIGPEEFSQICACKIDCCGIVIEYEAALTAIASKGLDAVVCFQRNIPSPDIDLIFRADELEVVSGGRYFVAENMPEGQVRALTDLGVGYHDAWPKF